MAKKVTKKKNSTINLKKEMVALEVENIRLKLYNQQLLVSNSSFSKELAELHNELIKPWYKKIFGL